MARLVSVADGFQVWAHKATCTEAEVLEVSSTIARGIADALSTRAAPPTKPIDPRAVELYLRAREELRRFWGDHPIRAARLLDEAATYAPESGQILGARDHAHVHAWGRSNNKPSLESARASVEAALATGAGEGYLASALLNMNLGEPEVAARDFRVALARAPMSAAVHEHVGRLLVEIEPGPEGRQHLETALQLDAGRDIIIAGDLARLAALDANWAEVDRIIAPVLHHADPSIGVTGVLYTSRFAAWRGDLNALRTELGKISLRMHPIIKRMFDVMFAAYDHGSLELVGWNNLQHEFVADVQAVRLRLVLLQRMAEFSAVAGFRDAALETFELCGQCGLVDVVWADRCPALATLRGDPRWAELRRPIAERAARVLAAYRATA